MALGAYRNVAADIKYWVVFKITEEKVIAKERTVHDTTRTIEGSLDYVRRTIRSMDFRDILPFKPNPEKIIELWY